MNLIFRNARLVCPEGGEREGDLFVANHEIAAEAPGGAQVIDCGGKLLAPALIDLGAFAMDKAACRAGGIARIGLMPDQSPVLDGPGIVQRRPVETARAPASALIANSARSVPSSPRVAAAIGWTHSSGLPMSAARWTMPGPSSTGD